MQAAFLDFDGLALKKKQIPAAMFPTLKQETKTFLCDQLKVILNVSQLVLSHRGHGNNNAAL